MMRGDAMRLFFCDDTEIPLPPGHRFPHAKYRLLRESLLARGVVRETEFAPSPAVSWDDLSLAHDPPYLQALQDGSLDAASQRRIGFPWSPELVLRSRRSVGGTVEAARHALAHGLAGNLAGGTHHAFRDHGEGYCVFNDVGTAIHALRSDRPGLRASVVDLDVHQGNGTAAMFEGDAQVFTLSMHGRRNFPFRKQQSTLDVELDDGCDDDAYLAHLDAALPKALDFEPDLVFYIAGADILASDSLGHLDVTLQGLHERDGRVLDACARAGVPLVMVMGGGYSKPIEKTVEAHVLSYEELARRAR